MDAYGNPSLLQETKRRKTEVNKQTVSHLTAFLDSSGRILRSGGKPMPQASAEINSQFLDPENLPEVTDKLKNGDPSFAFVGKAYHRVPLDVGRKQEADEIASVRHSSP